MSHVHAFSCIHTFHLLYSSILCCWCVFDCLSFSLSFSLFLALVCTMAPKCKSTSSQNPLRSEAYSSSSDPTPSHVQFRAEKACKDFLENFCKQGIHSKRQVILSYFSNTNLPTVIYSKGWESLCSAPVTCPSMIIQEFYSNMHGINTSIPHFFSRVRDTRIVVTPEIVSEVLHVPKVAHPDYPSCDCLRTVSKDEL